MTTCAGFHPQCRSQDGIPQPGTYLVCIQSRRAASSSNTIPLEPAGDYRKTPRERWNKRGWEILDIKKEMPADFEIRLRGQGKDGKNIWICLPCLEGLMDERWGFGHTNANPGNIDPNTTMRGVSQRLVAEIRECDLAVPKGHKKRKIAAAYKLDPPNVNTINLWKAVHASKNRETDTIDPKDWSVIKRYNMIDGPNGTKWPTYDARDSWMHVAGIAYNPSLEDVQDKSLSELLALVDYRKGDDKGDWGRDYEGYADSEDSADEATNHARIKKPSDKDVIKSSTGPHASTKDVASTANMEHAREENGEAHEEKAEPTSRGNRLKGTSKGPNDNELAHESAEREDLQEDRQADEYVAGDNQRDQTLEEALEELTDTEHDNKEDQKAVSYNGNDESPKDGSPGKTAQETEEQQEQSTQESGGLPSDHASGSEYHPDEEENSYDDYMTTEPGESSEE